MIILYKSCNLWLIFLTSYFTIIIIEGRNCVFDSSPSQFFESCGYCGICKKVDNESTSPGTCDDQYLTKSGLFTKHHGAQCELKNHCKSETGVLCQDANSSTGRCHPLYGTYKCQCKEGYFGKNCENKIDSTTTLRTENKVQQYADVNNVVFTPIFYSTESATVHISLLRKGFGLKIYVNNGREQLVYNNKMCGKNFETLNKFCLGLFSETNNIRLCKGINPLEKRKLKNRGCLISLQILYPPSYDRKRLIYKYIKQNTREHILANLETASVGVYNHFENSVIKPVLNYSFDMINIHKPSDFKSKCIFKINLVNCGKTMASMPKVSAYSDMAILWLLKILAPDLACLKYEKVATAWRIWKLEENHDELEDKPLHEIYQKKVYLLKEKPLTHGIYKVKLTLTVTFSDYVQQEKAYGYFEVVRFPIQIILLGGSLRKVFYKKPITFEILLSIIPDRYELDKNTKTVFTWRCDHLQNKICKPFKTLDTVRKVKGPFPNSSSYKFTLDAKTVYQLGLKMEQHPETQVVKFSPRPVLSLVIRCLKNCGGSTFKSNPQEIIYLKVSLEEPYPHSHQLTYNWKYKCLDNAQDKLQGVEEIQIEDNIDNTALVVNNNMLNVGSKYLFVVSVEDSSPDSRAEIVIETDQPPIGINCKANPKKGIKGVTYFSVSCKGENKVDTFPSPTFEFYDRHYNEAVGRMLGYSMTGDINRIILTRDQLYVRVINFFGSSIEIEISVQLNPFIQGNSSLINKRSNVVIGNYIDRIGLLSSRSDLEPSRLFWDDSTAAYLESLVKEPVHELMGAILLQNTLHEIACEKLVSLVSVEYKFKCSTILNLASIMQHATETLTNSLSSANMNARLMNTIRTSGFITSVLHCSSVVLELNFLHRDKSSEIDVHDCLKTSTYRTIDTLTSLQHLIIALQVFPSLRQQWYVFGNEYDNNTVQMFVHEVTSNDIDDSVEKTSVVKETEEGFIDVSKGIQYYTLIIFKINPFWWGSGKKISTDVFSKKLYKENKPVENAETDKRVDYGLTVNNFFPATVSGVVTQPDSVKGPEVTDFQIAIYRIIPAVYSKTFIKFTDFKSSKTLRVLILNNTRPDFDLMNANAVNVTENSNELSFDTDSIQNDSFYYIGILPGSEVAVGGIVNYTFVLFSARCVVWKHKVWMSGNKCIVNQDTDVEEGRLVCSCSLLTITIAGYLYIPTNRLNPFSDLGLFLKPPDNPLIVLFLLVVFLVFIILLFWIRTKDRDDRKKLTTFLLEDNSVDDTRMYLVGVFTGSRIGASTTSNVGFKLFGEKGNSRTHVFSSNKRQILQSGSDDWFLLFTPQNLGTLLQIQLWIDYSGRWPNWYCNKVYVCDISSYETSTFTVEKWFGVNINDVCLDKFIKSASPKDNNTFGAILSDNIIYGFRDLHFFVSLFFKHPRSVVTQTERLSVALSSVLLTICLSVLFYSISSPVFEDFSAYHISSEVFFYSFICSTIATTFGWINMSCFRRSYSIHRNTTHSHSHSECEKQRTITSNSELDAKDVFEHPKSNKISFVKLFCNCVDKYIKACYFIPVKNNKSLAVVKIDKDKNNRAWMITLIASVVSSYTIIVSSLTFGEVKTSMWMTFLLVSLFFSIFILLSVIVILISLICSFRKVRIFDILSHRITIKCASLNLEKEMYGKQRKTNKKLSFDTYVAKKLQRSKRVIKVQFRTIRVWVMSFIIESIVLLVILYLVMDEFETFKYFQSSSTVCNEVLSKRICEDIYYGDTSVYNLKDDVLKLVLPKLYKTKWYNGEKLSQDKILFHETGWMNDITSRLIGNPQLFQVRVQKNQCKIPSLLSLYVKNCFPVISPSTVDRKNYSLSWTDDDWNALLFEESPWKFTEGVGMGVKTSSDYHIIGSYVTSLLNTLELAKLVTNNLIDTDWMDEQTRVIVLQFLTYNPNNNIFTSSYFVTEVFPTHFIKTTHTVRSIGFYYHNLSFQGIIFITFSVFFLIRMVVTINIMGVNNFFKDLWNCYDVFIVVVYFTTVVDYVQLMYVLGREQEVVKVSVVDKNVRLETVFQSVGVTRLALCYTFVSVAVRFVRITRINDRCRQYLSDFVNTKTELFWTLVISFVSLYRQFRLIMYFIEPPSVYDVVDILGFTSKYHPLQKDYTTTSGKVVALALFQFSEISLFSFTLSLIHHHRQLKLRRVSLLPRVSE